MYQSSYSVPQNRNVVYDSSYPVATDMNYMQNGVEDERFLFGPLLLGGLAGGAIGYGLGANRPCCGGYPVPMPMPYYPQQPIYYPQNTQSMSYNNYYI